ncbi:uncharacterized protein V3H82_003540 isoform 2-T3 [Fundulus diaphanus]
MWRQQVKQRLDAAEEQRHQILDAAFSPEDLLHTSDVQQMLLVKEEAPEEQSPGEDQSDLELLHIKEEQEELWTSQQRDQPSVKEETDPTGSPVIAVLIKREDGEEKPLFSELHQTDNRDVATSSSAEQMKAEPDEEDYGGVESSREPNLNTPGDATNSSETEVSEDEEMDCPDSGSETEENERKESRTLESGGQALKSQSCSECGQQLNLRSFQSHTAAHSAVRCPSCSFSKDGLRDDVNMDPQREVQTDLNCFNCADCGKSFNRKNHLKVHMRIHTVEKTFVCDVCRQTFSQKTHLNRHVKIHTGEKPFGCAVCGQTFSRKSHLNRHGKIHTGEKPFGCDVCGQRFHEKAYLDRHVKIHSGEKPFSCDVCGQRFSRKAHLERHMGSHAEEKPFGCDVCGQRFTHKSALNRHMIIHTGEKPFSCDVCGQRFNQKSVLMTHVRIHTGDKPYACDFCGLRFNQKSNLNSHIKIHTGYRPFSCDVCGQKFNRKGNLNMHMRIHAAGKNV